MQMELAPRLNLITGDNGLGKSFLLDVAWWALTRKWPRDLNPRLTSGYPALPSHLDQPATIGFRIETRAGEVRDYESRYSPEDQGWPGRPGRPWNPGLVIYAQADGGFSVWDPARNYWRSKGGVDVQERVPGYVLSSEDLWMGLETQVGGKPTRVCRGLLDDWSGWIREGGANASLMASMLSTLVVNGAPVEVGPLLRLSVDDARDIPSIRTPSTDPVPIVHASAGIRRAAGLAYMLVWSWTEHLRTSGLFKLNRTQQIVLLVDELEAHLHPRWQRRILPACLEAVRTLTKDHGANPQMLAATHSPLVLASVEPHFDEERDRLFHLEYRDGEVRLDTPPWAKQGDVLNWLVSGSFGLRQARSVEAERAIEAAEAFMRGDHDAVPAEMPDASAIHVELLRVLAGHDPFWPRWIVHREESGATD